MDLEINGKKHAVDVDGEMPLLWVLRDELKLTGTKFGCGKGLCGACTVHVNGEAVRSCSMPVSKVGGGKITTIEGLSAQANSVQKAWVDKSVPQCGYCQSGQIMAAVALLKKKQNPTDADINGSMTNLCRCGTYNNIREAIHTAANSSGKKKG